MIRDAIPSLIKRPGHADIVVLRYYRDSLDTYDDILNMVAEIWNAKRSSFLPKPDEESEEEQRIDIAFALHLGMTTAVPEFRAEKIAYRDGYKRPGEDGVYVDQDHFKKLGLPESLEPAFDADGAVALLKEKFAEVPIRASAEPNRGFCEYRLYSSLAEVQRNHKPKIGKAAFLHVPADKSPKAVELGADVVAAFITALIDGSSTESKAGRSEL
ncbi:MAG: hypothetical protein Q9207_004573 [Kuettlingeria erythrocarpa]